MGLYLKWKDRNGRSFSSANFKIISPVIWVAADGYFGVCDRDRDLAGDRAGDCDRAGRPILLLVALWEDIAVGLLSLLGLLGGSDSAEDSEEYIVVAEES